MHCQTNSIMSKKAMHFSKIKCFFIQLKFKKKQCFQKNLNFKKKKQCFQKNLNFKNNVFSYNFQKQVFRKNLNFKKKNNVFKKT
jgi:hypothetical protein